MICKLDLLAGGTYKGRSLRYLNFVLLLMFTLQHTVHTEIGSDRFHLLSAVSTVSIATGAEIREIKIDH